MTPATNAVHTGAEPRQMASRALDALLTTAASRGEAIATEQFFISCRESNIGGDNPVHTAIAQLRKAPGNASLAPR